MSDPHDRPRVLLAFFSRPGENYSYGGRVNLQVGSTEVVARMIAGRVRCEVFRIEAVDAYSRDYDATVRRNVEEQEADARPRIVGDLPSLDAYDVVLLGSPIWNVRPPMIMTTFVEALDWAGTTLHPFVTYAMSRLGDTLEVYRDAAPGARLGEGLAVQGETAEQADDQVAAWLRRIGLG